MTRKNLPFLTAVVLVMGIAPWIKGILDYYCVSWASKKASLIKILANKKDNSKGIRMLSHFWDVSCPKTNFLSIENNVSAILNVILKKRPQIGR